MAGQSKGKSRGFYSNLLIGDSVSDSEDNTVVNKEVLSGSDVFEVERIVDKRVKTKKKVEYLVLWKRYSKEEASWVLPRDVTATAVRLFDNPCPPQRLVLDSVSCSVHRSLGKGLLKQRSIVVEFPRHVFNFLFNHKGRIVKGKPGRTHEREDFDPQYFSDDFFTCYNKHHDGCTVTFPIYLHSYGKVLRASLQ